MAQSLYYSPIITLQLHLSLSEQVLQFAATGRDSVHDCLHSESEFRTAEGHFSVDN